MTLDLQEILRLICEGSPFNRLLGIKAGTAERGRVVLMAPVRPEFVGDPRRNVLHGGLLAALVDTVGGAAAFSVLEGDENAVSTVDLRVDYLEPGTLEGDLRADARVLRRGSRVCHVRITLTQSDRVLVDGTGVFSFHKNAS